MPKTAILNIRMDPTVKKAVEELYGSFGITVTDAVNMFLHKSLMVGGLPFELNRPQYNVRSNAVSEEAEQIGTDPTAKQNKSAKELFEDLDHDV